MQRARGASALILACSLVACSSASSSGGSDGTNDGGADDTNDAGTSAANDGGSGGGQGDGSASAQGDAGADAGGGVPTTLTPGTSTITLTVSGLARTAVLYVPANATSAAPLVLAMHGNGDTDTNFLATSGLEPLADTGGFVLVAPQGITRDVTVMGETVPEVDWDAYNTTGNIDTAFVDALRTKLAATGQVNAKKTFIFGYSQGGYFSFLYGLTESASLSCAAVLAASSPFGGASNDPLITGAARKIPVAMQIGTNDGADGAAKTTAASLKSAGFPVQFNEIAGAGHVPIPGSVSAPLDYCLGQSL